MIENRAQPVLYVTSSLIYNEMLQNLRNKSKNTFDEKLQKQAANFMPYLLTLLPASGDLRRLLITFANSVDPVKA